MLGEYLLYINYWNIITNVTIINLFVSVRGIGDTVYLIGLCFSSFVDFILLFRHITCVA